MPHTIRSLPVGAAFLAATLAAFPALAEPATKQGAQQIKDDLVRYLGRTVIDKGIVTVTPQGDAYALGIELDSNKLGIPAGGPDIQFGPYAAQLTPNGDGTYGLVSGPQSLIFSYKSSSATQPLEFSEKFDGCSERGTYDLKLAALADYTAGCSSGTLTVRSLVEDIDVKIGKLGMQLAGKPAASGAADIHMTADISDGMETITVKNPVRPIPPMVVRADAIHQDVVINGAETGKIRDILAALVDKGTPDKMAAAQDDIKARIRAALPLWQNLSADILVQGLSQGTPVGIFKVATVDQKISHTGVVGDGNYAISIKAAGIELPNGLTPDWSKPFIPTQANVDLKLSNIDFDGIANLLIQNFDASKKPPLPEGFRASLLGLFAAAHLELKFAVDLAAPSLDAKGEGTTTIYPGQQGTATVSAAGLDALTTALNGASSPGQQRMMMGLAFLKGLAKTGSDGRPQWNIDFDSLAKKVTVNGQSFGPGAHQ